MQSSMLITSPVIWDMLMADISPNLDPLARLEGEPYLWYGRFLLFATLGITRNIKFANREDRRKRRLSYSNNTGCVAWYEAAKKWRWEERVAAYDLKEFEADEAERRARQKELRDRAYALGNKLLDKGEKMLQMPLVMTETSRDGKKVVIMPAEWVQTDAARMVESGVKIAESSIVSDREINEVAAQAHGRRSKDLDVPANQLTYLQEMISESGGTPDVSTPATEMPVVPPPASGVLPDST